VKYYIINAHKGKSNISLVSANQAKTLISSTKKCVLLFLRENQPRKELVSVKESLEVCIKRIKKIVGGVVVGIQISVPGD
jgi:hypothetical protein